MSRRCGIGRRGHRLPDGKNFFAGTKLSNVPNLYCDVSVFFARRGPPGTRGQEVEATAGLHDEKRKWSLQHRFLDPTLSEYLSPLPNERRQLEGATSC
jgi:hypothetical protein